VKTLDVNNMLDAACDSGMPNISVHISHLESAVHLFAVALADHLKIKVHPDYTKYEQGYGGLCACFYAASTDQPCPALIHEGDPGGDWEDEDGEPAGPEE